MQDKWDKVLGWGAIVSTILYTGASLLVDFPDVFPKMTALIQKAPHTSTTILLLIVVWAPFIINQRHIEKRKRQRPKLIVNKADKQDFNIFHCYGIVIENHPIEKSFDGLSDTNISVDFIIFDKKEHNFRCNRWDETFTRKQMRKKGEPPIKNTSVTLEADKDRRIAFFLGRFNDDEHLYIHTDDSYIGNKIFSKPKQIISKKKFKVKAIVKANRAENLIVWLEIQNTKNNHPIITITKSETENKTR